MSKTTAANRKPRAAKPAHATAAETAAKTDTAITPEGAAAPVHIAAPTSAPATTVDPVIAQAANAAAAAADQAAELDIDGKTLRVRSVLPSGRRRAGRAFGKEPVDIAADELDEAAVAALLGDPHLLVELV